MFTRQETRKIKIGRPGECNVVFMGGSEHLPVQSMTNTDTRDVTRTVSQIHALEREGCELIRVTVPDMDAALAVREIKKQISIPLVVDIHFDYKLAIESIKNGADKVRINPGNIGSKEKTLEVVRVAKEYEVPIRIGVNGGSLDKEILQKYDGVTPEAMVESAMNHVHILEELDFTDIVVSIKCSDVQKTVEAYKLMATKRPYPLHIGLTEAGTTWAGTIKGAAAIGSVLSLGIGDTIRVSLTGDPIEEVRVGRELLSAMNLGGDRMLEFVSCPTCGRTRVDLIGLANSVEQILRDAEKDGKIGRKMKVAVMGCAVNGPGEASNADIGLAGGDGEVLLFEKGKIVGKIKMTDTGAVSDEFAKRVIELSKQ